MRTQADVDEFINDLDTDEVNVLVEVVANVDPLQTNEGKPRWNADQMNLIQRFQQFVKDHPAEYPDADEDLDVEVDESGLEKETLHEESEDIAGTGETEEQYVERMRTEGNAHNLGDSGTNRVE